MTSQPLETIPEEPTPTPAPTPARVTAKNPGRVASSKRLAERSRLAREAEAAKPAKNPGRVASSKRLAERSRLAREAEAAKPAPTTTTDSASDVTANDSSLSLGAMLGISGLIVSAAGLYYQHEERLSTRRT